jgi:hypothetical protein
MKLLPLIAALATTLLSTAPTQAAVTFSGGATWTLTATLTGGGSIVANTLTITDTLNGFFVSGYVDVDTAGATGLFRLNWQVTRAIVPGSAVGVTMTDTLLDGFSDPESTSTVGGTFGPGQAVAWTSLIDPLPPYAAGSQSQISTFVSAGAATWLSLTDTSVGAAASPTINALVQDFQIVIEKTGGTFGTIWRVDVPVGSGVNAVGVPETTSSICFLAFGGMVMARRRRQ